MSVSVSSDNLFDEVLFFSTNVMVTDYGVLEAACRIKVISEFIVGLVVFSHEFGESGNFESWVVACCECKFDLNTSLIESNRWDVENKYTLSRTFFLYHET